MMLLVVLTLASISATAFAFVMPSEGVELDRNTRQFPFHVRLLLNDSKNESRWCSGSLIHNEWVLTAAQCTEDIKEAVVHLGAEIIHKVTNENFIKHLDWKRDSWENDIALIKIPHTHFSENIYAVKLPAAGSFYGTYDGDEVISSGWCYAPNSADIATNNLFYAEMNVIPNSQCRKYYGSIVSSASLCIAAYRETNGCIGDSGSPLILKTSQTQIGLTLSGSRNVHEQSIPLVLTGINYYLDWIKETTGISL